MSVELFNPNEISDSSQEEAIDADRKVWQCDICGIVMLDLHCKLRCVNCGFMRDCSDP